MAVGYYLIAIRRERVFNVLRRMLRHAGDPQPVQPLVNGSRLTNPFSQPQDHDPRMKTARTRLSARYLRALRAHLKANGRSPAAPAQALGRATLAAGFATLDLAVMHEQAVVALAPFHDFAHTRNGALKRAGVFFTRALKPMEAAQRSARESNLHLRQRNELLHQHATALARGNRRLEREVARREAGESALRLGRAHYQKLFRESQVMQKKLRQLTRQIIVVQEEERKQISRELHDEVVQTLVGINVELSGLTKETSTGLHHLKAKIVRTQRLVENSVNAVHRFARDLRPAVLDDLGLIPALHAYCKSLAARKSLRIKMTAFGGVETLGAAERTVLFRVAQEALNNVVRHARATSVTVNIIRANGTIRLEIMDNGRAFPVQKILFAKSRKRLGLLGMQERVEMVGGKLTVESTVDHGTTVRAELPFPVAPGKK
jgi:signal transduction histidine kinase